MPQPRIFNCLLTERAALHSLATTPGTINNEPQGEEMVLLAATVTAPFAMKSSTPERNGHPRDPSWNFDYLAFLTSCPLGHFTVFTR
jgi:hypothetical protein